MRKVVSLALFGDADRKDGSGQNYHAYLSSYVLAHLNLFPVREGWRLHVHVDDITLASGYVRTLRRLAENGLIALTPMGDAVLTRAMLWRMAPVFLHGVDYTFCRDIDCIPMPRDRAACDVFITSKCAAHSILDSVSHAGVMGGLCGFNTAAFRKVTGLSSLDDLYSFAGKSTAEWAQHGTDQIVLNRLIEGTPGMTLLEHRYAGWHAGPGKHPPKPRGEYRCKALSTPTPDVGKWCSESVEDRELTCMADRLANHLGAAGYDIAEARTFWERYGDPEITKLVKECET